MLNLQERQELHEIHFPVQLGGLKKVNAPAENSYTSDFNFIKIILLMFTGSQDLYLTVCTNLIIGNWEKCWITYFKCLLIC